MDLPSSWDVCGEPWLPLKPQTQWWALDPPLDPLGPLHQAGIWSKVHWLWLKNELGVSVEAPMRRLRMWFGHLNVVIWGATGGMWNTSSSCSLGYVSCVISAGRLWLQVKIWGSWQGLAGQEGAEVGQSASGRADVRSSSSISCLPFWSVRLMTRSDCWLYRGCSRG